MYYKSREDLGSKIQVDKTEGILREVVIVEEGVDKSRGYFSTDFLKALVRAGNTQEKGVKCRFEHPNSYKNSLGTFLGRYKNFRFLSKENQSSKVVADLYLDEITQKTQISGQGISMWDYVLQMASQNPDMLGNSIVFEGKTQKEQKEVGGDLIEVESYELSRFIASDLVDMPAATSELFKSQTGTPLKKIFRSVQKELKKEKQMNLLEKIKKSLYRKELTLSLIDGSKIKILTKEGKTYDLGDKVLGEEGIALKEGTYELVSGELLEVKEGKISKIHALKEDLPSDKQEKEEKIKIAEEKLKTLEDQFQNQQKNLIDFQIEINKSFDLLLAKQVELEEKHHLLAQNTQSKYVFQKTLHASKVDALDQSQTQDYSAFREKYLKQKS